MILLYSSKRLTYVNVHFSQGAVTDLHMKHIVWEIAEKQNLTKLNQNKPNNFPPLPQKNTQKTPKPHSQTDKI